MTTAIDAASFTLALAERIALPAQRTFYPLVDAVSAFQGVGIDNQSMAKLLEEADRFARWEKAGGSDIAEETLLVIKSRLDIDRSGRRHWLNAFKHKVPAPGAAWRAGTKDYDRISLWMSLVSLNQDLAPEEVVHWASGSARRAKLLSSRLRAGSFNVLSQVRFGHRQDAHHLARGICKHCRQAGYWGNTDLFLTLQIVVNLLTSGVMDARELDRPVTWITGQLQDPSSLSIPQLALATQFLWLIDRRGTFEGQRIRRLLRRPATSQCGLRQGTCEHAPVAVRADTAFYITSFEPDFDEVRSLVRDKLAQHDLVVIDTEHPSLAAIREMPCRWCRGIGEAMMVVADLTALDRPNVLLEFGFAVGQGKPVLLLFNPIIAAQRGYKKFPSDVPHLVRVQYTSLEELREELGKALPELLDSY